jgi:PAS domain S-box-containing protein
MRNLEPGGETLSVLTLEDNALDSELVHERLRLAGYNFQSWTAANRAQFVEYFAQREYDLVLADYSLPDFDGLSALKIVRQKDKFLPFIFVSGALGEHVAVETLHHGATDYVLKQRMDRLTPAVSRALKEYAERLSRIEAEALLKKSELMFQQLTNALPAMVWVADHTGSLTYCNDAWKEYLGGNDVASWCDRSILHVDDLSQANREWRDALNSRSPLEIECRFHRSSDATYRWHLVRITPIRPGDSDSAWVGTCTDLHAQRLREEALRTSEKLVVVGRMAGAIAHEINNPLESLVNLLYLLRDRDTSTEPARSLLQEADQQLFRISSITRQTLTFYRDKAALGDIDCRTLLEDSVALFRAKIREKQIRVTLVVQGQVRLQARGGEIRQILINLVSNAIDAMKVNGSLILRAEQISFDNQDWVRIEVEDSGHGISAEIRKNLFQPFFSTKGTLGTGLGLWVTRNIVEHHRGKIEIDSVQGKTVISVMLPAEYRGDEQGSNIKPDQAPAHKFAS